MTYRTVFLALLLGGDLDLDLVLFALLCGLRLLLREEDCAAGAGLPETEEDAPAEDDAAAPPLVEDDAVLFLLPLSLSRLWRSRSRSLSRSWSPPPPRPPRSRSRSRSRSLKAEAIRKIVKFQGLFSYSNFMCESKSSLS